jgi:hypothetical protein
VIRFACLICGVKYSVKPSLAGKTLKCDGCLKRMTVPQPERAELVAEAVEDDDEDVPEAELVDVSRPEPRKPQKRERGLIVYGDNGSVELVGTELVFRHSGDFGLSGRVRSGTYRHDVLGLTEIEYVSPNILSGGGRMRFVFGNERRAAHVAYVLDTQTITFGERDAVEFLKFKKEVERFKRQLLDEIRMNR